MNTALFIFLLFPFFLLAIWFVKLNATGRVPLTVFGREVSRPLPDPCPSWPEAMQETARATARWQLVYDKCVSVKGVGLVFSLALTGYLASFLVQAEWAQFILIAGCPLAPVLIPTWAMFNLYYARARFFRLAHSLGMESGAYQFRQTVVVIVINATVVLLGACMLAATYGGAYPIAYPLLLLIAVIGVFPFHRLRSHAHEGEESR